MSYFGVHFQMNELGAMREIKTQVIKPVEIKKLPGDNLTKGPPQQSCQFSGSQMGTILLPRRHLAISQRHL